ncbi:MAG: NAD(P)-binding protein [Emcibacter sp.]|nr:NAD(P)-binding protein [Emcibacter sp.]
MKRKLLKAISRRDFMGGVALGLTASTLLPSFESFAFSNINKPQTSSSGVLPYPPSITGLRGDHLGSFEVSHALAWEGRKWPDPDHFTDDLYDLVVVGGGLSGLASAHHYLKKQPLAKILILDTHDDFGGHAKRNEFTVKGKKLIGYGGSQSIDAPAHFSPQALQILKDLGVEVDKFYHYYDRDFNRSHGLSRGIFFHKNHFNKSIVERSFFESEAENIFDIIESYPLKEGGKEALTRLWEGEEDFLADMPDSEKINFLRGISYDNFLRKHAKMPEDVILLLRNPWIGLWGVGYDALSALEAYRLDMPGFDGLRIYSDMIPKPYDKDEPYIFHFPDGNSGLARLLVRKLIPTIASGNSMEDIIKADFDYTRLDEENSPVRIRLMSTVIKAVNQEQDERVDVTYVRGDQVEKIRARHVIMACNNNILPHICPQMPEDQKEALKFPQKVPLSYINVALNNWHAFQKAGYHHIYSPQGFFHNMSLDFPVSMGGYNYAKDANDPIILHVVHTPTRQGEDLPPMEQHKQGRHDIYNMTFADYETKLVEQLQDILEPYGFDAERDIAAITVNRWPHGYAYEYNELWEPWDWIDGKKDGPHILGRRKIGRISIANADSQALAYVKGAFDAAVRAVDEQLV